jgi:hypothetical protein
LIPVQVKWVFNKKDWFMVSSGRNNSVSKTTGRKKKSNDLIYLQLLSGSMDEIFITIALEGAKAIIRL